MIGPSWDDRQRVVKDCIEGVLTILQAKMARPGILRVARDNLILFLSFLRPFPKGLLFPKPRLPRGFPLLQMPFRLIPVPAYSRNYFAEEVS